MQYTEITSHFKIFRQIDLHRLAVTGIVSETFLGQIRKLLSPITFFGIHFVKVMVLSKSLDKSFDEVFIW